MLVCFHKCGRQCFYDSKMLFFQIEQNKILKIFLYLRYTQSMCGARKAAILRGFMSGLGIGLLYFSMFGMYGLSFWYGSTLVIKGEITAGDLTTSFFGILIASFALGTVCICSLYLLLISNNFNLTHYNKYSGGKLSWNIC